MTNEYLKIVQKFVEGFTPDKILKDGANIFPNNVVTAFKAIRNDRQNQEKYLTLLYLKIYRGHLECCHQSYELRNKISNTCAIDSITDPLLFEYNLITKQFDNKRSCEMITSSIANSWVEKNKTLLKYALIKNEYKTIKIIHLNIRKGLYWK